MIKIIMKGLVWVPFFLFLGVVCAHSEDSYAVSLTSGSSTSVAITTSTAVRIDNVLPSTTGLIPQRTSIKVSIPKVNTYKFYCGFNSSVSPTASNQNFGEEFNPGDKTVIPCGPKVQYWCIGESTGTIERINLQQLTNQ